MKRICRILPVLLVPLLLLAACKQEPPDAGSSEVSETLPEITNPTFVSVDIETLSDGGGGVGGFGGDRHRP